eukprot:6490549-Amphidinium_carterae.1
MSWGASELAKVKRQLAALDQKLAAQAGQKPNRGAGKGANRGGGKGAQTKSGGWWCTYCKKHNSWQTPACYFCKQAKPQEEVPGRPVLPAVANATEAMLKKHLAAAKDSPALQGMLKESIAAVQQQKRDALSPAQRQTCALLCADQVPICQDGPSDKARGPCQCGKGKAQGGAYHCVSPLGTVAQRLASGTEAFFGTLLQWARCASPTQGTWTAGSYARGASDPHGFHSAQSSQWGRGSTAGLRPAHGRSRRSKADHRRQPGRAGWRNVSCSALYRRGDHARKQRRAAKARTAAWRAGCRRSYGRRPQTHPHHVGKCRSTARDSRRSLQRFQREYRRDRFAPEKGQNSARLAGVTVSQVARPSSQYTTGLLAHVPLSSCMERASSRSLFWIQNQLGGFNLASARLSTTTSLGVPSGSIYRLDFGFSHTRPTGIGLDLG